MVHDVVERVETFARLFDVPLWRGMHWRTEPGWLEDTTNNGQPVTHGYFTGRADVGTNRSGVPFGFEVDPAHLRAEPLQGGLPAGARAGHPPRRPGHRHGEWGEWDAVNQWLAAMDAPTCMSGWLRNHSALFHYQDTRRKLGYVTEIHPPRAARQGRPLGARLLVRFLGQAAD